MRLVIFVCLVKSLLAIYKINDWLLVNNASYLQV